MRAYGRAALHGFAEGEHLSALAQGDRLDDVGVRFRVRVNIHIDPKPHPHPKPHPKPRPNPNLDDVGALQLVPRRVTRVAEATEGLGDEQRALERLAHHLRRVGPRVSLLGSALKPNPNPDPSPLTLTLAT